MRRYLHMIGAMAIAAIVTAAAGCSGGTDPATVTRIKGMVTDRSTGDPLWRANVTTVPPTQSVMTLNDGSYVLADVVPGTYTVTATKDGYRDASVDVTVGEGKTVTADVALDSGTAHGGGRGWALRLDGADDYLSVPYAAALDLSDGSFTVEAWVNPSGLSTGSSLWNVILNKSHINTDLDFLLGIDDNRRFSFITRSLSNFLRGSTVASVDAWYHVAGVQDAETRMVTLYVNGAVEGQGTLAGVAVHNNAPLFIGAREYLNQGRPSDMFQGIIDDVRIWNIARTQQQITGAMYKSFTGAQPGLIANWKFDEGEGGAARDLSGTYMAHLIGGPMWITSTAPIQ